MRNELYILIDCNNFFVSCERVFCPKIKNSPALVLSSNDGCVIARSQEVKRLGIPMGIPYFKIKDEVKKHKIEVFSSNFKLYRDMSARVMSLLYSELDNFTQYSIDEAFATVEENSNVEEFCHKIREKVFRYCGIPVSVGIAKTKTLAKLANKVAKDQECGVFYISSDEKRLEILKECSVGQIWGIGKQMSAKLSECNINTAFEFQNTESSWVSKNFGVSGLRTYMELKNMKCSSSDKEELRQSIMSTRSFSKASSDFSLITNSLSYHAANVCRQLRQEGQAAKKISFFIKSSRFIDNRRSFYHLIEFESPTNDTFTVLSAIKNSIDEEYVREIEVSKTGVHAFELCLTLPADQTDLFGNLLDNKKPILTTVDLIQKRFGDSFIRFGSEFNKAGKLSWHPKSLKISKEFTTNRNQVAICH